MSKKKNIIPNKLKKPKKIGLLLNKVFDEYKKKQKNKEKKEIKIKEEIIKKDLLKLKLKEKEYKIKDDELKKRDEQYLQTN